MTPLSVLRPVLALILLGTMGEVVDAEEAADRVEQSRFSGKAVPRFEALRYGAVNGRQGPSLQHPILWRYEKAGLPVLVIRETHYWVRVRDALGDEVWIQTRMLEDTRNLWVRADTILRQAPSIDARPVAQLKAGLVVELTQCDAGWCDVQAGRRSGYVPDADVWGFDLSEAFHIRTSGVAPASGTR